MPLGRRGALPPAESVTTIPLTGAFTQVGTGINLNGIARTPDRSALIVVQSNTGTLYRVDPATGASTVVDVPGHTFTNGDGLLTVGRTLYVVQNRLNQVAVVRLNPSGTAGTLTCTITDPNFDVPTTVAKAFGAALPAQRPLHHPTGADHAVHGGRGPSALPRMTRRAPGWLLTRGRFAELRWRCR